jgi:hypothetical protein
VLAQLDLLLAQLDGALELFVGDRRLHVLDDLLQFPFQLPQALGVAHPAQLYLGARLVDDVDRLVGLLAIGDVAARLVDRRPQGAGGVGHLVKGLVAALDPLENLQHLPIGGRCDLDRLESAQQRAVLLDVLAVLLERRGADA